jgi:hypothetical protein
VGSVRFEVPAGTEVLWDGKSVDATKELLKQKIGFHRMVLRRPDAEPIRANIRIKPKEQTVIRANE